MGLADAVGRAAEVVDGPAFLTMGDGFYAGGFSFVRDVPEGHGALLVEDRDPPPGEAAGWVLPSDQGRALEVWKGDRRVPAARRIAGGFLLQPPVLRRLAVTQGTQLFETLIDRSIAAGDSYHLIQVPEQRWNVNTPEQLESLRDWYQANVSRNPHPAAG